MSERITVYFDYVCPFSWRAAELLAMVSEPLGLDVTWEHFSIYQYNYDRANPGKGWQLWNERADYQDGGGCMGLVPFLASLAARSQGHKAHDAFRLALQRAIHRDYKSLTLATIMEVAASAGLSLERFEDDLSNPENRTKLAHEHSRAAAKDLFGTPTVVFPHGEVAYMRLQELPTSQKEAEELFAKTRSLLEEFPYLQTLKRPRAKDN